MSLRAMTLLIHKRVIFRGEIFWLHGEGDGVALLSPLNHYDERGNLTANPFVDLSYAIVNSNGEIWRYRETIGHVSELEYV